MTRNQSKSNFIEQIRGNLSSIIEAIIHHPYLDALEKKEVPRVKLEIFVCEQYYIITNDKRNLAFAISKASGDIASELFVDCLDVESNALGNLAIMAEELFVDKSKIDAYELLAGCQAYTNFLTKLAVYGSDAEILTALLIDLPVWGANCSKISTILKKNYDISERSCVFLDEFACPLPEKFVNKSKEIIETATLEHEKSLYTAARMILDYELCFWDTIYKHSIIN
jgi:thiaminase